MPGEIIAQGDGHDLVSLAAQLRALTDGTYIGVALVDIDADRAHALKLGEERGVEIKDVTPGSPAEAAGLKSGDVLLTYNGENILGAQQLSRLVSETPAGRKVRVQYWRDGKEQSATVTIKLRPERGLEVNPKFPELTGPTMRDFQADWQHGMQWMMFEQPTPIFGWKSAIGLFAEPLDGPLARYFGVKQGVLVRSVDSGSAAEKAGIQAGDVIMSIGDRPVNSCRDIGQFVHSSGPGTTTVGVTVMRNHKSVNLTLQTAFSNYAPR
jgi:serine protease Do